MTALIVSETPLTGPTVEALKGGQRQGASVGWGQGLCGPGKAAAQTGGQRGSGGRGRPAAASEAWSSSRLWAGLHMSDWSVTLTIRFIQGSICSGNRHLNAELISKELCSSIKPG